MSEYRLDALLHGLLRMEGDNFVRHSGVATSRASAASSPAAFAARTRARSCPSRLGKKLALYQRVVQHRASHSTPVFSLRLAHHDDVSRELKLAG